MNQKMITVLSVIFIILTVIATQTYWSNYAQNLIISIKGDQSKLIESTDSISKISIKSSTNEIILQKQDDWKVDNYAIDKQRLTTLLEELDKLRLNQQDIVSVNRENNQKYSLTPEMSTTLSIDSASSPLQIVIGDSGISTNTYYIKLADKDAVYLVEGKIRDLVLGTVSDWRDKTIVDIDQQNIDSIEINIPGYSKLIVTKDDQGRFITTSRGKTLVLGTQKADSLFALLHPLSANNFPKSEDEGAFKYLKKQTISFYQSSQLVSSLEFAKNKDIWWVKKADADTIYIVPSTTVDELFIQFSDLTTE